MNLAEDLQNISQACKVMGFSRDTFYRYEEAVEANGVQALLDQSRRKPNLRNRDDPDVEQAELKHSLEEPAHGQKRASNELRKIGVFFSPSGIRSIWLRHDLACFKDRLKALEARIPETGEVLTKSQLQALERKRKSRKRTARLRPSIPGI